MIRIDRPAAPPGVLLKAGIIQTEKVCTLYAATPEEYSEGSQRFKFKQHIYADPSVKQRLCNAQYRKCCYCESAVVSPSQGQIEHFRPKHSARQTRQQPKIRPGYYWLAYCWENLLVICGGCNIKKSDLFPLEDPTRRARSHHDDITAEDPLLVDPSSSNPRLDIRFKSDAPVGVTKRGRTTIELLGLDHLRLSEERRVWLDRLQRNVETLRIFGDKAMSREEKQLVADIKKQLANAIMPNSQYSSMAIDFLEVSYPNMRAEILIR